MARVIRRQLDDLHLSCSSCVQPAYQDADSTALALQAVAPIGVTHFSTEHLQRIAGQS